MRSFAFIFFEFIYIFIIRPETPQQITLSSCELYLMRGRTISSAVTQSSDDVLNFSECISFSLGLFFLTKQLKKRNRNFYYFETKGPQCPRTDLNKTTKAWKLIPNRSARIEIPHIGYDYIDFSKTDFF